MDPFDTVDPAPVAPTGQAAPPADGPDPLRPDAVRGRYPLPNPATGRNKLWSRVTRFNGLFADTYNLGRWELRCVVKGIATMASSPAEYGFTKGVAETLDHLASLDVKAQKDRLDNIASAAKEAAGAHTNREEGTALHKSAELADFADGNLVGVPARHRQKIRLYLDALAVKRITVAPGMIERVVVSEHYGVAGKLDRIYRLFDGSYVIGDLKTGDSLDYSMPEIAAQLDCYRDGVNNTGVYDGRGYDRSIRVRDDIGIVVHLPSTRDEVRVYWVDLQQGRKLNEANLMVRDARKVRSEHVSGLYGPEPLSQDEQDAYWLEALNGVLTYDELVAVAARARCFGQWNERLAGQARVVAGEMRAEAAVQAGA